MVEIFYEALNYESLRETEAYGVSVFEYSNITVYAVAKSPIGLRRTAGTVDG